MIFGGGRGTAERRHPASPSDRSEAKARPHVIRAQWVVANVDGLASGD
jgi:hypothetical protein